MQNCCKKLFNKSVLHDVYSVSWGGDKVFFKFQCHITWVIHIYIYILIGFLFLYIFVAYCRVTWVDLWRYPFQGIIWPVKVLTARMGQVDLDLICCSNERHIVTSTSYIILAPLLHDFSMISAVKSTNINKACNWNFALLSDAAAWCHSPSEYPADAHRCRCWQIATGTKLVTHTIERTW